MTVQHFRVLVAACLLIAAPYAFAGLGQDRASIALDHSVMGVTNHLLTQGAGYEVDEMQTPRGSVVKEFVAPSGSVFAVRWSGHTPPNLQQLLGDHYAEYLQAARIRAGGHHLLQIRQGNLVLTHVQYLRRYDGQAYVPALVPNGVDVSHLN